MKFPLGRVCATPGALALFESNQANPLAYLQRHASGDWGDVPAEDARENEHSVAKGFRILSSYPVGSDKVWIITEADRSVTTFLLPEEVLAVPGTSWQPANRLGPTYSVIVTATVTTWVNPTNHELLDRLRNRHRSVENVVLAEIQSNLESVSYVRKVSVHSTQTKESVMIVKFFPNDKGNPPGKLADAEIHFDGGPLEGLKLIGFAIWERKGASRNVTFPARQYTVNGERRSFALLRPVEDPTAQERVRDVILAAFREHEQALAETAG